MTDREQTSLDDELALVTDTRTFGEWVADLPLKPGETLHLERCAGPGDHEGECRDERGEAA